jgi:repressor LexA
MNLTPKQLRVLKLVDQWRRTKGYSPTMQELADQLGVSKVTVFEHVESLIAKGALERDANKARSLTLSPDVVLPDDAEDVPARQLHGEPMASLSFPLVGKVAAGYPIEKFEQRETIAL